MKREFVNLNEVFIGYSWKGLGNMLVLVISEDLMRVGEIRILQEGEICLAFSVNLKLRFGLEFFLFVNVDESGSIYVESFLDFWKLEEGDNSFMIRCVVFIVFLFERNFELLI